MFTGIFSQTRAAQPDLDGQPSCTGWVRWKLYEDARKSLEKANFCNHIDQDVWSGLERLIYVDMLVISCHENSLHGQDLHRMTHDRSIRQRQPACLGNHKDVEWI